MNNFLKGVFAIVLSAVISGIVCVAVNLLAEAGDGDGVIAAGMIAVAAAVGVLVFWLWYRKAVKELKKHNLQKEGKEAVAKNWCYAVIYAVVMLILCALILVPALLFKLFMTHSDTAFSVVSIIIEPILVTVILFGAAKWFEPDNIRGEKKKQK